MTSEDENMRVIVIDDDQEMRRSLDHLLASAGWEVETLSRGEQLAARLPVFDPDVILTDMRMPGISGMELLKSQGNPANPPFVLISAHGDIPLAVEAMQAGAYTFLEKPYDPRRLLTLLRNAARSRRLRQGADRLRSRLADLSGLDRVLMGDAPVIRELRDEITDLSDARAAALLLGEAGVGKSAVARAMHDLSARAAEPFITLDFAMTPTAQIEAELTGSDGGRNAIDRAQGGTLFLNEVGQCPPDLQAVLFRALESAADDLRDGSLHLVSSAEALIEGEVEVGAFRRDLFYRLSAVVLSLPPIRDRRDDIPLLFSHFIAEHAMLYETEAPETTAEDFAALLAHEWPGNIRELRHIAERRILAARRGRGSVAEALRLEDDLGDTPDTLREAVAAFERRLIAKALKTHAGRMDEVAEALGIGRRTLNEKIVKLGLDKSALL